MAISVHRSPTCLRLTLRSRLTHLQRQRAAVQWLLVRSTTYHRHRTHPCRLGLMCPSHWRLPLHTSCHAVGRALRASKRECVGVGGLLTDCRAVQVACIPKRAPTWASATEWWHTTQPFFEGPMYVLDAISSLLVNLTNRSICSVLSSSTQRVCAKPRNMTCWTSACVRMMCVHRPLSSAA